MEKKQSILTNFFKSRKSHDSEPESSSDNESSYLPSKMKRMFENPMFWTRVKSVKSAVNQRVTVFDVETDIMTDKSLKQVRRNSVRETIALLFDPETYRCMSDQLTTQNHLIS